MEIIHLDTNKLEAVRAEHANDGFYTPLSEDARWISQIGLPVGLRDLKDNWDGYGAKPINPALLKIVAFTSLIPGGDGSLQFEFRHGGREVGVHFDPMGNISYVYTKGVPEVEQEEL